MSEIELSPDLVLGLQQIAKYIGRSEPTARNMALQDDLPAVRVRGRWISSKSMLDRYLKDKLLQKRTAAEFTSPACT